MPYREGRCLRREIIPSNQTPRNTLQMWITPCLPKVGPTTAGDWMLTKQPLRMDTILRVGFRGTLEGGNNSRVRTKCGICISVGL